jgi:hypothetical protein
MKTLMQFMDCPERHCRAGWPDTGACGEMAGSGDRALQPAVAFRRRAVFPGSLCRRIVAISAAAVILGGNPAAGADRQPPPAAAGAAGAGSTASFSAFRLIGDWNIFDPNRVRRSTDGSPPVVVDTISLVGTMQYEKGLFAFFDSPDSNYRKALHVGDAIAQFTVTRITPSGVELTRDSKQLSLAIGRQLRRPAGGEWTVGTSAQVEPVPAASTAPTAPAIPADASDTLKRLMEQRQKQLRQ